MKFLGRYWGNRGSDRNARDLQILIDYLVAQTGGQMYYPGRDMGLAHRGMGITHTDWSRFVGITAEVAGDLDIGPAAGRGVMAFLESLNPAIVDAENAGYDKRIKSRETL